MHKILGNILKIFYVTRVFEKNQRATTYRRSIKDSISYIIPNAKTYMKKRKMHAQYQLLS